MTEAMTHAQEKTASLASHFSLYSHDTQESHQGKEGAASTAGRGSDRQELTSLTAITWGLHAETSVM